MRLVLQDVLVLYQTIRYLLLQALLTERSSKIRASDLRADIA